MSNELWCRVKKNILLFSVLCLLFSTLGCEAFVRKFTRKSNKEKPEEMVLAPEEWKGPKMTKEEQYRQYYIFWKSWQDELMNVFSRNSPQKKKVDCAHQAVKNLVNMRALLNESKQKQLDPYIKQMVDLEGDIKSDVYGASDNALGQRSERLKMNIQQNFSYNDIKNDLI